ncbi:Protein MAIN-LIKE 2 [Linum grandiflorum]
MGYEQPLQGDPHQVGTGSSHASVSVGPTRVRIVSRFAPSQSVTQRADNNDGWLLKYGLEDGGPRIHHVIPSFGGHIAYRLWRDGPDACKMADLSFYSRPSMLKELMDTPLIHTRRGVASFVQSSGLYHLGTCMTAPLDTPLLQAFIERWEPDTNTFHMPFGEMTVTLHDVWYILRVPICGTPLLADPDICSADIVAAFLGYQTSEGSKVPWMKSGAVHVRGLIARAASMGDVDAAKMWLFCLLGSSLFVDKTSDRVRVQLVEFIRVTDQITKYAWGTATLAWLYLQLGKATRADIVGRAGCLHLLQSWIHEYFPHTRKSVAHPEPLREGEPLCGRWASTDDIASGPDGRDKRLGYYRRLLDSLESEDVTWLPFGPDPAERVPDRTFRGVIRLGDIAEHYDPIRVLRQFGYVQDVPDEVPWPSECTRGCLSPYVVTWATSHDGAWSSRGNRRYISVMYRRCSEEEDVAHGYMQWYMDRTHPRILSTIAERVDCPPELVCRTVD